MSEAIPKSVYRNFGKDHKNCQRKMIEAIGITGLITCRAHRLQLNRVLRRRHIFNVCGTCDPNC